MSQICDAIAEIRALIERLERLNAKPPEHVVIASGELLLNQIVKKYDNMFEYFKDHPNKTVYHGLYSYKAAKPNSSNPGAIYRFYKDKYDNKIFPSDDVEFIDRAIRDVIWSVENDHC